MNNLEKLAIHGQGIWLNYLRRSLVTNDSLKGLIKDGITGVVLDPQIIEKAMEGSNEYDEQISMILSTGKNTDPEELYWKLVIKDLREAADQLSSAYENTGGDAGYVSVGLFLRDPLETKDMVRRAERLWKQVDRKNLMIEVPAIDQGYPVIDTLISRGINVNVTHLFSTDDYERAARHYLRGLEKCENPAKVASVASFSVSKIDELIRSRLRNAEEDKYTSLMDRVGIANSRLAIKSLRRIFSTKRWKKLERKGARIQKLLFVDTKPSRPELPGLFYVNQLIAGETISSMVPSTLFEFMDHGTVGDTLGKNPEEEENLLSRAQEQGLILDKFLEELKKCEIGSLRKMFQKIHEMVGEKISGISGPRLPKQILETEPISIRDQISRWRKSSFNRRLWQKDASLWFDEPVPEIEDRLGWLTLPETSPNLLERYHSFARMVSEHEIDKIVLMGMGGSSLAPRVFQQTFGNAPGYPELIVLDSTHPNAIERVSREIDLERTLFAVASKSGTTLEPNLLLQYFWHQMSKIIPDPGNRFIAITDPGSPLQQRAKELEFREIFLAAPDLGGRYSALTAYGLVPAALIGIDVCELVDRSRLASEASSFCISEDESKPLRLGAALGKAAKRGKNKLTFIPSRSLENFPIWLEQLIAESTGKDGKGILPIVGEPQVEPEDYGPDRFFILYRLGAEEKEQQESLFQKLRDLHHPAVKIELRDRIDIGAEIFRWEMAIASAGSIMGIHPFNQPNVERSKELARKVMRERNPSAEDLEELGIFHEKEVGQGVEDLLSNAKPGSYISIQGFLSCNQDMLGIIDSTRLQLMKRSGLPVTFGEGPRFLHSTGQLHKGGKNGLFLQLVDDPVRRVPIPDKKYSFADVVKSQSIGDYGALKDSGKYVLRINLGSDPSTGLRTLNSILRGG